MANDTLKTALPDTFNVDWLNLGGNENVLAALDNIGGDTISADIDTSLNAIQHLQPNFGLGESFIGMETGGDELAMPEVSQETMDKLTPAIGIGAGEILTRGRGLGFPEGLKPKIRAGGSKGVAFTLAIRANEMGKDFAKEHLGMKEGSAAVTGGVAAYGAWKGAPWLAKTILSDVKVGMATEVIEGIVTEAGKGAWKEMLEQGVKIGAVRENTINAASLAGKEAMKKISEETADVLKERMGKVAAEGWDDVAKRILNPSVAAKVGKYLGAVAPKLSAKLAISATAVAIPEPVSTFLGGLGMAWTAYDIFNLAKQMPALHALIWEGTPEESVEDQVINEMSAEDSLFTPDEQRAMP
jgi:hypothetical protein